MFSSFILNLFFLVIATEAVTEIVVKSRIFEPFRERIKIFRGENKYLEYVTTPFFCAHCFSVWAGLILYILYTYKQNKVINIFIFTLVIHRLSNYLHMIVDRIDKFYAKKE
jgi:hypothetical protein